MSSPFQRLTTSALPAADKLDKVNAERAEAHLSQEATSLSWENLFGPIPYIPEPGETMFDVRHRRNDYLQHVRHYDNDFEVIGEVTGALGDLLNYYEVPAVAVKARFKNGPRLTYLVMPTVPGFEFFEEGTRSAAKLIEFGQARLIKAGIRLANVFPIPGLEYLHNELLERLEAEAKAAQD